MISRLTASAALFAVLATAALTFATETQAHRIAARGVAANAAQSAIVVLPAVVVIAHRTK